MKYLPVLVLAILFSLTVVSAVCTITLDKESYIATETATVTVSCSSGNEKSQGYTITWRNSTDTLEIDTGTTPATLAQSFFETYTFPEGANYTDGNVTINGTNLAGFDTFNVSASGSSGALVISNVIFTTASEIFIGKNFGVEFTVKDSSGNQVSNAQCQIDLEDGRNIPIVASNNVAHNGRGQKSFSLTEDAFDEGRQYISRINCFCGTANTNLACIAQDGSAVTNAVGSASNTFTTNTYLTSQTIIDRTEYMMKEEIFICANVTNPTYSSRLPLRIFYQVRCSADSDNDDDTDRALIVGTSETDLEERGISANTTQNQCKRFILPEAPYLQGRTNECYASSSVWVLSETQEPIIGYFTTSSVFNITSDELNINADWELVSDNTLNTIVNLSSSNFREFNGTGTGNLDLRIGKGSPESVNPIDQYATGIIDLSDILNARYIKSMNATNLTGDVISPHLEILDDGYIEVELRDVDITPSGWYNITLLLNDWEERQTDALEGISNKTGTFHLSIDCPAYSTIGETMTCSIVAQVEDEQTVQKEVDFTCYLVKDGQRYSSANFNQMVTRSPVTLNQQFTVPSSFSSGQQYVVQCEAGYYNLGSRVDMFFDTFTALSSGESNGWSPSGDDSDDETQDGRSPITGGSINEGPELSPESKSKIIKTIAYILGFALIVGAAYAFVLRKKKRNFGYS